MRRKWDTKTMLRFGHEWEKSSLGWTTVTREIYVCRAAQCGSGWSARVDVPSETGTERISRPGLWSSIPVCFNANSRERAMRRALQCVEVLRTCPPSPYAALRWYQDQYYSIHRSTDEAIQAVMIGAMDMCFWHRGELVVPSWYGKDYVRESTTEPVDWDEETVLQSDSVSQETRALFKSFRADRAPVGMRDLVDDAPLVHVPEDAGQAWVRVAFSAAKMLREDADSEANQQIGALYCNSLRDRFPRVRLDDSMTM